MKLPQGWKAPKSLPNFSGEHGESIVKHIARYTMEIGELANVEYSKMRFFPSSLTKNAFTWFCKFVAEFNPDMESVREKFS